MRTRTAWAAVALIVGVTPADARPTLRQADLRVTWLDALRCDAEIRLQVDTDAPASVDHRVLVYEGGRVDALAIGGRDVEAGAARTIGRTESVSVRLPRSGAFTYQISYRAAQADAWAYRCPVWLPAIATDGLSRAIHVRVTLPPGATVAAGTLPRLTWTSAVAGEATLAHLPAFIRTPFARPGEPLRWAATLDPTRLMDLTTIVVIATASLGWAWRRRR